MDLVQDGFDLIIKATGKLAESSLVCRKIYSCKGYTVAILGYLKKFGEPTKPEELHQSHSHHQCICYSNLKTPSRWLYKDKVGKDINVDVNVKLICNSAQMELAMVLADHGICRLPEFAMEKALEDKRLQVLFADYPAPDIDVYAIYPSRKHLSAKVRTFIDLLAERMPSQ